jgi:hypothetical protein
MAWYKRYEYTRCTGEWNGKLHLTGAIQRLALEGRKPATFCHLSASPPEQLRLSNPDDYQIPNFHPLCELSKNAILVLGVWIAERPVMQKLLDLIIRESPVICVDPLLSSWGHWALRLSG